MMFDKRLVLTLVLLSVGLTLQACSLGLPEDNLPPAASEPAQSPYLLHRVNEQAGG